MSTNALKAVATGSEVQAQVNLSDMKPKEQIAYLLDKKRGEIAKMLPKHLSSERLLKVAQIAATTTPTLAECDVASLVGAIGQCAQMGLEPNTVLGHAYLVPFNTKRKDSQGREKWVKSVQVIIGYKGLIDLARRSGQIVSIASHERCENDYFKLVYGLEEILEHTPAEGERGEVVGFYAVAKLKDGGYCFEYMSRYQIEKIRDDAEKKNKKPSAVWADHFIEMGRKTVIRRLAKYLPLSVEFQTAATLDSMAEGGKDQHLDAIDGEFMLLPEDFPQVDPETGEQLIPQTTSTEQQGQQEQPGKSEETPEVIFAYVAGQLRKAKDMDELGVAADLIQHIQDGNEQTELGAIYKAKADELMDRADNKTK